MNSKIEAWMDTIYFDPAHPVSFSGPQKLYDFVKKVYPSLSLKDVQSWLSGKEAYSLHKPVRRRIKRNSVIVKEINQQWDVDLMDMARIASDNDGVHFVLLCIDIFSCYVWTYPLKNKSGEEVSKAFISIFQDSIPKRIRSDKGTEFIGQKVQRVFKKFGVHHFVTQNEVKANYAERAIKTIKGRIYKFFTHKQTHRYIDILQDVTGAYNNSVHRSIGMAPAKVTEKNLPHFMKPPKHSLRKKKKYKFEIGDYVRISHTKKAFSREYHQRWTGELFKVVDRSWKQEHPTYTLHDYAGDTVEGTFYEEELQKVIPNEIYRVEKVLKRRQRRGHPKEVLARWLHWPPKYDSWIPESHLRDYKSLVA